MMDLIHFLQSGILESALMINTFGVPMLVIIGLGVVGIFTFRALLTK